MTSPPLDLSSEEAKEKFMKDWYEAQRNKEATKYLYLKMMGVW